MTSSLEDSNLHSAAEGALEKLEKYYDFKTKHSVIGVMVDPHFKLEFFCQSSSRKIPSEVNEEKANALATPNKVIGEYKTELPESTGSFSNPLLTHHDQTHADFHPMKKIKTSASSTGILNSTAHEEVIYLKQVQHSPGKVRRIPTASDTVYSLASSGCPLNLLDFIIDVHCMSQGLSLISTEFIRGYF